MITINDLRPAPGAVRDSKRRGRGQGSGLGKTGGRGQNGYKSRSGARNKLYFEGGQTPLTRRVPKRGFKSYNKLVYQIVNVADLEKLEIESNEINPEALYRNGIIHSDKEPVKILGNGELTKKYIVKAHAFSASAREKIEKANGKIEVVGRD
jgi:large subunit ribosomal protein L15